MGIFGAEAIDPTVIDRFAEHGTALGLRPGTLVGAYGLAEATLLVTSGRRGEGLRIDAVEAARLAEERRAVPTSDARRVRRVASCGRASIAARVRIVEGDRVTEEGVVGEIQVAGAGLMRGYLDVPGADQPFTDDGWLRTGDAGYLSDGELFVTGRIKDLIIVMGRNHAPEEFEWLASQVPGVRPGRCVAFAGEGESEARAVVVFEPAAGADVDQTVAEVRRRIAAGVGAAVEAVVAVPKGTIAKTTSGKLRRAALRDAYLRGEVQKPRREGRSETAEVVT